MQNKQRCIRLDDDIFSFIREIHSDYSKNIGEFISDVFYYAQHGSNPDNGNNIKQFFEDVENNKWIDTDSTAYKLKKASDNAYAAFSKFMNEYSKGDFGMSLVRDFIISEQSPKSFWYSNLPKLTTCQKIIFDNYDVPIMKNDFVRYFALWLNEPASAATIEEVKVDVIDSLYRKHHPLEEYTEEKL